MLRGTWQSVEAGSSQGSHDKNGFADAGRMARGVSRLTFVREEVIQLAVQLARETTDSYRLEQTVLPSSLQYAQGVVNHAHNSMKHSIRAPAAIAEAR